MFQTRVSILRRSVSVEIKGVPRSLKIDTGSNVSIFQLGVSENGDYQFKNLRSDWEVLDIKGLQVVPFTMK